MYLLPLYAYEAPHHTMPALEGKHAVVFGAGLVTPPLFEYLYDRGCKITIATRSPHKIEAVVRDITAKGGPGTLDIVACDVTDDAAETQQNIEQLVVAADIVVSLLPWTLHMQLANSNKHGFALTQV